MAAVAANNLPPIDPEDFDYYDYQVELTTAQATALGLDKLDIALQPFDDVPPEVIEKLGLSPNGKYVVEYWQGACSDPVGEWFGGVLRKTPPPTELQGHVTSRAEINGLLLAGLQ